MQDNVQIHRVNKEPTAYWGMDPLPGLGLVASIKGDYAQAIEIAQLQVTVTVLHLTLATLQLESTEDEMPSSAAPVVPTDQPLVEPLTARN